MKRALLLLTTLASLAFSSASLQAALSYWDGNGTDPGAGIAPTGQWGTDATDNPYWNSSSLGTGPTNAWVNGDTAVFSAGTDATDAFIVNVDASFPPSVGGLIFEEGEVTLQNSAITMTNQFEWPVICYTNAILNSALADGADGAHGIKKTGPGTLSLGGSSSYAGTNIVAEGFVACTVGGTSTPLGASGTSAPTVVSNGATLNIATSQNFAETAILDGSGVTNGGALRFTSGTLTWSGFISLASDAKVTMEAGGTMTMATANFTTNGAVNCNLTIGGNGGTIRLNGSGGLNRSLNIGNGLLIKEGASTLRFENPSRLGFPITWRGGNLFMRVNGIGSGDVGFSGYGTINVEAGANQFQMGTGGPSITFANALFLAAGAKPTFNTASGYSWTQNAAVSGPGGINKTGQGALIMNGAKTYTGDTTISAGILSLSASGSIANSALIVVASLATNDVSAVTGGFVLQSAQTLGGGGTVTGNVTAKGALSPGEPGAIGLLTFNNDLTIAGSIVIDVDTPAGFPPNDSFSVVGALTNAGTGAVMVRTNGAALAVNDTFPIFNVPVPNGQAMTVFGGGVVWTNELTASPYGQIRVVSLTPVAPPNLKVTAIGLNSVTLGATGAGAYQGYGVLASTDVGAPMSSWKLIGGATANGSGVISFTDTQALEQTKFYRLIE
jgi:autotransporter-associated beta strand protein